ncbi:hypothetical protein [Streptomyces sp.]|uniref:hypothetical protein n=1 Tax=Streptomyces sp. TaxID=1931 RepID=UPI002F3FC9E1
MSASITLHCDTLWRYAACAGQLITDAATVTEAREAAKKRGWRIHPDGNDYCPNCSGNRIQPTVNVVQLRPDPA